MNRQAFRTGKIVVEPLEGRVLFAMATGVTPTVVTPASSSVVVPQTPVAGALLPQLSATPTRTVSTVGANGDTSPHGAVFAPSTFVTNETLQPGDLLVSNSANNLHQQGVGATILRIKPDGTTNTFFQGNPGFGFTTALGVLQSGFVVVGNTPTVRGQLGTVAAGSLLFLDGNGNIVTQITNSAIINGPWGMAIHDGGSTAQIFVSNVLSGTITRLDLTISAATGITVNDTVTVASGYPHVANAQFLATGPGNLAYDPTKDVLYVASAADNRIYTVTQAGTRKTSGGTGAAISPNALPLNGPIGLRLAPNGNLLVSNNDSFVAGTSNFSLIVEISPITGQAVAQRSVNPTVPGSANGLAVYSSPSGAVTFAAVNATANTVEIWVV